MQRGIGRYLTLLLCAWGGAGAAACASEPDDVDVSAWTASEDGAPAVARYDLSCHGAPLPGHAPGTVAVDGFTVDSYALAGVAGATVELVRISDDQVLAATSSTAEAGVSLELTMAGAPVAGYFRTAKAGYVTSHLYPSGPVVADQMNVALPLIPPAWRDELAWYAGVELDPTRGIVSVIVTDCRGARVEGATVTFDPPVEVVYWDPTFTDASADRTTINGHAWAFNVPAGDVRATVTLDGITWRDWPMRSFADGRTLAWRAP